MKTSNKILAGFFGLVLLVFFLFLIFVRFNLGPVGMGNGAEFIKGNGNIATQKHNVSNYNDIRLDENFDVTLQTGSEFLKISTDDNLLSYIEPAVKNGTLVININEKVSLQPTGKVKMTIGIQQLENLSCAGSTHIASNDTIKSERLDLAIAGSGAIDLILQTDVTSAAVSGSGYMEIKGTSQELSARIAGSGRISAENLVAQSVDASVSGSGSAKVHAIESLNASVAGSGDLMYKGKPKVQKSIGGSGQVSEIN